MLFYFQGLGKRRFKSNNSNKYQPDLLAWVPDRKLLCEGDKPRPPTTSNKASVYKIDYRGSPAKPIQSQYIPRPKTSFDEDKPTTTTYRYSHGGDNPNRNILNAWSNAGFTTARVNKARAKSARFADRETVASCMSWYHPSTPRKCSNYEQSSLQVAPAASESKSAPVAMETTMVPQPPPPKTAPAATVSSTLE